VVTASARSFTALHVRSAAGMVEKMKATSPAITRHGRRRAALVGHVQQIDARHGFEGFTREMDDGAVARGRRS